LLQFEPLRRHPARAIADLAILETEHVIHALAIDEDVVVPTRRILPIGAIAIERAFQPLGNRALDDLQPLDGGFGAHRLSPSFEESVFGKADRFHDRRPQAAWAAMKS